MQINTSLEEAEIVYELFTDYIYVHLPILPLISFMSQEVNKVIWQRDMIATMTQ